MPGSFRRFSPLDMQRTAVGRQGCLLHRLAQCRMRVAGARHVLCRRAELNRGGEFRDQCAGIGPDDMRAQDAVGGLVRQYFTNPSVSAIARARAFAVNGNFPML